MMVLYNYIINGKRVSKQQNNIFRNSFQGDATYFQGQYDSMQLDEAWPRYTIDLKLQPPDGMLQIDLKKRT